MHIFQQRKEKPIVGSRIHIGLPPKKPLIYVAARCKILDCTLLVLQLNRSMLKHFIDQEWTSPLGLEFARKQAHPRVQQKHQVRNHKFLLLNLLVMVLLHLHFVEG